MSQRRCSNCTSELPLHRGVVLSAMVLAMMAPPVATQAAVGNCPEALREFGWDQVPNRGWDHSACSCTTFVGDGDSNDGLLYPNGTELPGNANVECNRGAATELTMDFSHLLLRNVGVRGYPTLVQLNLNLSHSYVVHGLQITDHPQLETVEVLSAVNFIRSKVQYLSRGNPNLVSNVQRQLCSFLMQPYGWDAVPDRAWDPDCVCMLYDDAWEVRMWDGTTPDGHCDVECRPTGAVMDTDFSMMGTLNMQVHSTALEELRGNWSNFVAPHNILLQTPNLRVVNVPADGLGARLQGNPQLYLVNNQLSLSSPTTSEPTPSPTCNIPCDNTGATEWCRDVCPPITANPTANPTVDPTANPTATTPPPPSLSPPPLTSTTSTTVTLTTTATTTTTTTTATATLTATSTTTAHRTSTTITTTTTTTTTVTRAESAPPTLGPSSAPSSAPSYPPIPYNVTVDMPHCQISHESTMITHGGGLGWGWRGDPNKFGFRCCCQMCCPELQTTANPSRCCDQVDVNPSSTSAPNMAPITTTAVPTNSPTNSPITTPPTIAPTELPTHLPTELPTHLPTISPAESPTITPIINTVDDCGPDHADCTSATGALPASLAALVRCSTPEPGNVNGRCVCQQRYHCSGPTPRRGSCTTTTQVCLEQGRTLPPTLTPTSSSPTAAPSAAPSALPTYTPSEAPTSSSPTTLPTSDPTSGTPTATPTPAPTSDPTQAPSSNPTRLPTTLAPSSAAPTKMECSAHTNCSVAHYCDAKHNCFPCVDRNGVNCAGHSDAIDGVCPGDGAEATECNPSGRAPTVGTVTPDAAASTGQSGDSSSMLAWAVPLAILGGAVVAVGLWAGLRQTKTDDHDGPAEASSFANPIYEPGSGAGAAFTHGGGSQGQAAVDPASLYADVPGFLRQGSTSSTTHVQMGADDLYASLPAESAYSELACFQQGEAAYVDVAPVPGVQAGIAPDSQYGFGVDDEEIEL